MYFYPRSPCGERPYSQHVRRPSGYFYPRSPCGERRQPPAAVRQPVEHFYPRSPCGERRTDTTSAEKRQSISIHALLAESDAHLVHTRNFGHFISIHALLAESDLMLVESFSDNRHFYPRSPCGERPEMAWQYAGTPAFLSTLSLRRATCWRCNG